MLCSKTIENAELSVFCSYLIGADEGGDAYVGRRIRADVKRHLRTQIKIKSIILKKGLIYK